MKKILIITLSLLFALVAQAQKDVTKFMGIPVDGSKSEMIKKLEAKGFSVFSKEKCILEGEFNGEHVAVIISSVKGKVNRVSVMDWEGVRFPSIVKNRFNDLCFQFQGKDNYISLLPDYRIPDDENIEYEILDNKKTYVANFFQKPQNIDKEDIKRIFESELNCSIEDVQSGKINFHDLDRDIIVNIFNKFYKKAVTLKLLYLDGEYRLGITYDNYDNFPNGEDL